MHLNNKVYIHNKFNILMNEKRGLNAILIMSFIAVITSTYLLYLHYSDDSSFCDISEGISCDIVNRSLYSEIFGIPVSLLGLLTFFFIFIATSSVLKRKRLFGLKKDEIFNIIYWLMVTSAVFALYLIYIEAFVLYAVCPLCVLLDIFILSTLIIIIKLRRE
mgnify:CR=1 FL=1